VEGAGGWEIKNYISVNGGYVCVQRCSVHLWEDCVGLVGSLVLHFVFSLVGFPSSSRSREKGPDDWEGPLPRRSSILTVDIENRGLKSKSNFKNPYYKMLYTYSYSYSFQLKKEYTQ
jgi:hypothetical protein